DFSSYNPIDLRAIQSTKLVAAIAKPLNTMEVEEELEKEDDHGGTCCHYDYQIHYGQTGNVEWWAYDHVNDIWAFVMVEAVQGQEGGDLFAYDHHIPLIPRSMHKQVVSLLEMMPFGLTNALATANFLFWLFHSLMIFLFFLDNQMLFLGTKFIVALHDSTILYVRFEFSTMLHTPLNTSLRKCHSEKARRRTGKRGQDNKPYQVMIEDEVSSLAQA
ncbi:hypothetical protein ACJX0J_005756, partial [Zea mays]